MRICVFTGTRADYSLLRGVTRELAQSEGVELQLFVSGTHLSAEHGNTLIEITSDGFTVSAIVPVWSDDDSPRQAGIDVGNAVAQFTEALVRLQPDAVVLLGDRLEAYSMATAATILMIPIVHLHGGEVTEGAMDDSLRHAITKLSYLHLVTTEEHRERVIQLGEDPDRVFALGAPVVDAIDELELLDAEQLTTRFDVSLPSPTALVTFHPAAMDVVNSAELINRLLAALDSVPELHVVFTGTNSDIGSADIREAIREFVASRPGRADYIESFGQLGYLSAVSHASVVVGNSSSVVLEAPVLGVPSVLVGDRQKGRPLSPSVLVPEPDVAGISHAVRAALDPSFQELASRRDTPFGEPGFAKRAAATILAAELPSPPRKRFFDTGRGDA